MDKNSHNGDPAAEKRGLKWWIHLIIAILSAIGGALGGMHVIAPIIN